MKILILEDQDDKFDAFEAALVSHGVRASDIKRIDNLFEFLGLKGDLVRFDMCIIDFFLPYRKEEVDIHDCTNDIYEILDSSTLRDIPVMAISRQIGSTEFNVTGAISRGIIAYNFSDTTTWSIALGSFLTKAKARHSFDFIGVFALASERDAYRHLADFEVVNLTSLCGIDAWEVNYKGHSGALFCLPRMGLVDASIATGRILESYSPRVAFMSGICGGFSNTELGQILITEFCWEYQSGKWIEDGFQLDSYQEKISGNLEQKIKVWLGKNPTLVREFEGAMNPEFRPSRVSKPKVAIFTSGSAVIASEDKMKSVEQQHRKVSGIDMEIFGFHRALNCQNESIEHFSCKTVVDKADEEKNDILQEYGCATSALMSIKILEEFFIREWE